MKSKKLFILIFFLLFSAKVYAEDVCSKSGYTVATINGIYTDSEGARDNQRFLKIALKDEYKNEKINYQYFYNPTHIAGLGDDIDIARQITVGSKPDYDFIEILNEASKKVTTQKLLLVGHSQGNFYANAFYDKVANKDGGVPSSSMGVYSVATPDKRVAGGGKYLTSDTDTIIAQYVRYFKNIMPPNTHIDLQAKDGNGHKFADVYLAYRSAEIVRDIKSSLDKLQTNTTQSIDSPCISPQKLSMMHKIGGALLAVVDPTTEVFWKGVVGSYNASAYVLDGAQNVGLAIGKSVNGLLASAIGSLSETVSTVINPNEPKTAPEVIPEIIPEVVPTPTTEENKTNEILEPATIPNTPPIDSNINNEVSDSNGNGGSGNNGGGGGDGLAPAPEKEKEKEKIPDPDITPPVITLVGDNVVAVRLNEIYEEKGAKALDDQDGAIDVVVTGVVDTTKLGDYIITYNATDKAGNSSILARTVQIATYVYIPKYTFGKNNGDGNNWQAWFFNGSHVYDWTDTYVDNYLHEQFKIKTGNVLGVWCGSCLERGIFSHDPQKGFELSDIKVSTLENTPQNNMNDTVYDVSIQWDSLGYTYNISHNSILYSEGHTDVPNMNNDLWIGWDVSNDSYHNFNNFPSGNWTGSNVIYFPDGRSGGNNMIMKPYPIYKAPAVVENSTLYFIKKGVYSGGGINQTHGRDNLTPFDFKIVYTDINNNPPQKVELNILNTKNGVALSPINMSKILTPSDEYNDGNFVNGEAYITPSSLYDTGDYDYYFVAYDKDGKSIRLPEKENLNFVVIPSTYKYLPKYSFGSNNGDGNDWQAWFFNGSAVYDWADTYSHNYLHEQFKIKTTKYLGAYCGNCLERGIFSHDPQKGFELSDMKTSNLDASPQNNMNNTIYDVSIQWDSSGYVYTISHGEVVDHTGHTDIANMNNDLWVGWDGSYNNFKTFPSGNWYGVANESPDDRVGGTDMMIVPYPVYDPSAVQVPDPVVKSSEKSITSFNFESLDPQVIGVINDTDHTVNLTVPYGTDIKTLIPTIVISAKASINPANLLAQDFTNPLTYIVTAEDNSLQSYIVSVTVSPNPNPDPPVPPEDTGDPFISSYTLNGGSADLSINPLVNNVSMIFHSNKKVNWMSIKIENESNTQFYKIFQSGSSCVDGTNICTKVWNGVLSGGGLLQSGNYRIKVHIKDVDNREYFEYLPSRIIVSI